MNDQPNNDDLDGLLRRWASSERQATVPRTASPALFTARRRPIMAIAVGVLSVIAVVAVSLVAAGIRTRSQPAPTAGMPAGGYTADYDRLVLHEGDTVQATVNVIVGPDGAVRFCDPRVSIAVAGPTHPTPPACGRPIPAVGFDAARLADRNRQDGYLTGKASVVAQWKGGRLTVRSQSAPPPEPSADFPLVPCAAPEGGWPPGPSSSGPLTAVTTYEKSYPGSVIEPALLRDARGNRIVYVLTRSPTGPIARALSATYGKSVCVKRSQYSRVQLDAACRALLPSGGHTWFSQSTGGACDAFTARAQLQVRVELTWVTQAVADRVKAQPSGIAALQPWLVPTR